MEKYLWGVFKTPPDNLGGYPGAPPNLGSGARGGIEKFAGGVPPAAGGPGTGPPPPPPNLDHLPLWMRSGATRGIYLAPPSVPKDVRSMGKYLWGVFKTSKETDISSDLDALRTEWTAAVEPENETSSTEAYFYLILSATMPLVFLTMMPGSEAVKFVLLHSIGRYTTSPLGGFDPFSTHVMGFTGDVRHGQLPTMIYFLVMTSATGVHRVSLVSVQCSLPSYQTMMTYYHDVDNWAKTLDSQVVLLAPPHGVALPPVVVTHLPRLMHIPMAWVAYFIEPRTPLVMWVVVEQLPSLLLLTDQPHVPLVRQWAKATCTHAAATPDRPIMQAQHRATHHSKGTGEWALVRAKIMFGFATPGSAAESATSSEKLLLSFVKKMVTAGAFQSFEPGSSNSGAKPTFSDDPLDYVQSMMQIDDDENFEYFRPEFYNKVEEDVKTEEVFGTALRQELLKKVSLEAPTAVFISPTLKNTFMKLDLGCGGDLHYPKLHHRLSPLSGVQHSKYYIRQTEDDERALDGASAVTPGDRKAARSKPPSLPLECWAFLHMLGNHIRIVGVATKNFDSHSKEVRAIRYIMESQCIDK